jgi:predicted PurR-regulated permease PerM
VERLKAFWESCKQITIYQAVIGVMSAATFLAPSYFFLKPIVAAQAGDIIKNLMVQEGIYIEELKNLPKAVEDGRQAQTRIESDLSSLKAQQQQVIDLLGKIVVTPSIPNP